MAFKVTRLIWIGTLNVNKAIENKPVDVLQIVFWIGDSLGVHPCSFEITGLNPVLEEVVHQIGETLVRVRDVVLTGSRAKVAGKKAFEDDQVV